MAYFHCLIGGGSSGGGYTLTVTCDSQFAGTTITCTDEVTTLTKTCPSASPYEVEFEIPNGGDWTISGVISGQTVTTGVSIPTTATLEAIIQKTITIYSAKEDTVTYTDIYGDTQTEVFASGQTSKQITIDIDASGSSITFTSGVAKDPSNLSNYYSKNVTIDSNTTEVYIMPNNAVYWYGYINNLETANPTNGWSSSAGFTPGTVTYNTNNVTLTSASHKYAVVGTSSKVTASKLHSIGYGSAEGALFQLPNKNINSSSVGGSIVYNANTNSHIVKDYSGNTYEGHLVSYINTVSSQSIILYALWYE